MKKVLFTLLLFGAGLSFGFARPPFSELTLSLVDGSVFDMEINDSKAAYNNTVDPENFFLVNEAFRFDASIRDLNRFIAHR